MVSAKNSPNVPEVGENYLLHCRWSLEEERGEKDLQAPCIAVCNHIQHDKSHLEKMFKTAISNVTKNTTWPKSQCENQFGSATI